MVRAAVCGTEGRQFESVPVYQKMNKEKKLSANTPSGFVDRYGKELALKENLIAKIEENFLKFGFNIENSLYRGYTESSFYRECLQKMLYARIQGTGILVRNSGKFVIAGFHCNTIFLLQR